MKRARILVIEDDPDTGRVIRAYLEHAGFLVETAVDGPTGLERALRGDVDLIVLDWMLPGLDGIEILRRLRPDMAMPVIVLTARGEIADRLLGFEHGADDYVAKPFHPPELVARVRAVLKRSHIAATEHPLHYAELVINPQTRQVLQAGREVNLTALEFDLLHLLALHPGRVFRRGELLDRLWGRDFMGVERVVDVHMSHLRQKLERGGGGSFFQTIRGVGYAFTEAAT